MFPGRDTFSQTEYKEVIDIRSKAKYLQQEKWHIWEKSLQ